jgi:ADP-heptose:LPS heptosyltransferase
MKRWLRTLILLFARLYGTPGAWKAAKMRKARQTGALNETQLQAPRILLVRPDHLGDLVLTTPVPGALRARVPGAQITCMVGPWASEIVARHPAIDRLITCPFPGFTRAAQSALAPYVLLFRTAQQLRRSRFDLAINLRPDFWWGAALIYLAGIPRRVGYALPPGQAFLTDALPFRAPEMATISNLRLASAGLRALGDAGLEEPYNPERYPLAFLPTQEERDQVEERLRREGIEAGTPVIVIHPGTGAAVKLWRTEAWANCANALLTSSSWASQPESPRILLTGSRSERPMLEEIAREIHLPVALITDATVGQLAALLGRASCVLAVDNGPAHIAVAQGTPTVQVFGPTDPRIFGPWGSSQRHIVIASTQRCPGCPAIPCGRLDWRPEELAEHPCVRVISEQQVLAAIETLFGNIWDRQHSN